MVIKREELSRSDRETVYRIHGPGDVHYEIEDADGKVWKYDDYIAQMPGADPPEPEVTPTKRRIHPSIYAGAGTVIAIVVSHFLR